MKIIIIGNGIAGSTAARFIRKWSDHDIYMISEESKFPFSRTALMYIFMGHLPFAHTKLYEDEFWDKNRIHLIQRKVSSIDSIGKYVIFDDDDKMPYDRLIIATGSLPNKYDWPGQHLDRVSGLYHIQDLQSIDSACKDGVNKAVIVGGGLIGIELAEMFRSRNIPVTMLVREQSFWNTILPKEESKMINNHIMEHHVDLRLNTQLKSIHGNEGRVNGIITDKDEFINCDYVGLTVGVSPNIEFVKSSNVKTNKGILVDKYLRTSDASIYAVGDCVELQETMPTRRSIEAVWYTGRIMGQVAASNICGKHIPYVQETWYNSAKFLDIEYQVYGFVPTTYDHEILSIYWQHPSYNKSIRLVYNAQGTILGFNLMGIRYRQEVCVKWINDGRHIEEVLRDLSFANFDPEFFEMYEANLVAIYNNKHNKSLVLESSRKLSFVQQLLGKK